MRAEEKKVDEKAGRAAASVKKKKGQGIRDKGNGKWMTREECLIPPQGL